MAFPVIAAEVGSVQATNSTSHVVTLPGGIVAGDLLLVFVTSDGGSRTFTFPAGWTPFFTPTGTSGNSHRAAYRFADGTEGASITVTVSLSEQGVSRAYRITGAHPTTPPVAAQSGTVSDTAPNPPGLDPAGWDIEDTLWFAGVQYDDGAVTATSPANYTPNQSNDHTGDTTGAGMALGTREQAIATGNPGPFTLSSATFHRAFTVAIRPEPVLSRKNRVRTGGAWADKSLMVRQSGAWSEKPLVPA